MADKKISEQLGAAIFEAGKEIIGKKLSKAQYDKSYKTTIVGCNRYFTDDVPAETQAELIKKYNIPEVSVSGVYYTFRINGNWYVKSSNNDFKLYEEVVVRVPNGNWDNMFIEVQRDTIGESSGDGILSAVKIEGNKLFYNGEEYRLQFGNNKRIMCVTKGKLHYIVETEDVNSSYIEAATAVLNGLTDDCDIEFDVYTFHPENVVSILSLFKSEFELDGTVIDWGDNTTTTYPDLEHVYGIKGIFRIKLSNLPESITDFRVTNISSFWNCSKGDIAVGSHVYVGGNIATVSTTSDWVSKLIFGENVKEVKEISAILGSNVTGELVEMSIPPCVNTIGGSKSLDTGGYGGQSNYVYIPPECTLINSGSFYDNYISDIEISPDGDTLTINSYAFNEPNTAVTSVVIPTRVTLNQYSFHHLGTRVVKFETGTKVIPAYCISEIYDHSTIGLHTGDFGGADSPELFIFVPETVEDFQPNVFYTGSKYGDNIIILYEGTTSEWQNLIKPYKGWWDIYAKNVKWSGDYDLFNFVEKELKKRHEIGGYNKNQYSEGLGISIDNSIISTKLGKGLKYDGLNIAVNTGAGLKCDSLNDYKVSVMVGDGLEIVTKEGSALPEDVNGKVTLKKATNNSLGGVKIGGGITVAEDGTISADGKEYIQGEGINITDNIISLNTASTETLGGVKVGKGLKISADGTLETNGGGNYTSGDGIEITKDDVINVKQATGTEIGGIILGEGLEYDAATGKTNTVPNIQQAVIIQEADAKYLLHEYTQVEYIAGNKICYAGAGNQIIVDGMVVYKNGGIAPNGIKLPSGNPENYSLTSISELSTKVPNPPFYSSVSLPKNGKWYSSNAYYVNKFELLLTEAHTDCDVYNGYSYEPDGTQHSEYSFANYYGFGGYGHFYLWNNIYPPGSTVAGETWEFGCVCCSGYKLYRDTNYSGGKIHITIVQTASGRWYFPFVSEAEYNAAVGLTYEPQTLVNVEETITEV